MGDLALVFRLTYFGLKSTGRNPRAIVFALLFLVFTIYNDLATYRAAIAEGRPALLNFAFGLFLLLLGTPIYFLFGKGRGMGRKDGSLAKEKS